MRSHRSSVPFHPGCAKLLYLALILLLGVCRCPNQLSECTADEECRSRFTKTYVCLQGNCMRKDFNFSTKDILGFVFISLTTMIISAGGSGAGNLMIPIYMFFFDFVSSDAIPLSRVTIFVGFFVIWLFNFPQRDPKDPNKFLINYNLASVMIPMALCGTQIGVLLSHFFPDAMITLVLACFLFYACFEVYERAQKETAKENALFANTIEVGEEGSIGSLKASRKTGSFVLAVGVPISHDRQFTVQLEDQPKNAKMLGGMPAKDQYWKPISQFKDAYISLSPIDLAKEKQQEARALLTRQKTLKELTAENIYNFGFMVISWVWISTCALLQGGKGRKSAIGIEQCGSAGFAVLGISQIGGFAIAYVAFRWNSSVFDQDEQMMTADEIINHKKLTKQLLFASFVMGILAGLFGIGGGLMLGVYLLGLGMHPQTANALSAVLMMFSSSSASALFGIAGAIQIRHAWILMCFGGFGAFVGSIVLKKMLKESKRPSLIVWILFGAVCLATLVLPAEIILRIVKSSQNMFTFGKLC